MSPNKLSEKSKHRNNFEVVLANSNATPIRSQDGFAYICCFCSNQYTNPALLKNHTLMEHNNGKDRREYMRKQSTSFYLLKLDITGLKCLLCERTIGSLEELFVHLQNDHKKLIFTDIKNQIIPFKFGGDDLRCAVCTNSFSKFKILLEHMHTHYRNYICEICDYGCINRRVMWNHQGSHKTGTFGCGHCEKVFATQQRKTAHEHSVHKYSNMPNKCVICNERFKSCDQKDQHMISVHGMSPIVRKCLACDKTFNSQNALRIHKKKYHLMERRFQCEDCDMTFFSSSQLKYHLLKHTGRKDFQCDVCSKWFTRKCVLREHMRIHANDRRFACAHCGRAFVQKSSYRGHMRAVHGEDDQVLALM